MVDTKKALAILLDYAVAAANAGRLQVPPNAPASATGEQTPRDNHE